MLARLKPQWVDPYAARAGSVGLGAGGVESFLNLADVDHGRVLSAGLGLRPDA